MYLRSTNATPLWLHIAMTRWTTEVPCRCSVVEWNLRHAGYRRRFAMSRFSIRIGSRSRTRMMRIFDGYFDLGQVLIASTLSGKSLAHPVRPDAAWVGNFLGCLLNTFDSWLLLSTDCIWENDIVLRSATEKFCWLNGWLGGWLWTLFDWPWVVPFHLPRQICAQAERVVGLYSSSRRMNMRDNYAPTVPPTKG